MNRDRQLTALFMEHARRHKTRYAIGFLLMPIVSILSAAGPKLVQVAIDDGIRADDWSTLLTTSLLYFAVGLLSVGAAILQNIVLQEAGLYTLRDIRTSLVEHISRLGKATFERYPLGVFVSRATADVEAIGESLTAGLIGIITDTLTIIAIFSVIFYEDVRIGTHMLVMLPLLALIIEFFRRRLRVLHERVRTLNGRLSAQLNEAATMRHEIRNFHLGHALGRFFSDVNADYRDTSIRSVSYDAATFSIIEGLNHVAIGLLFVVSLLWIDNAVISPGDVMMYMLYLNLLFTPFKQLGQRFNMLQASYAALNKIDHIMTHDLPEDGGSNVPADSSLTIDQVSFAYGDGPMVLNDVSVSVPASGSLAIVGPTGSGKTTMARLLARLYDVDQGRISVGGVALETVSRDALKHHVVLIPQEPAIFSGTIRDNITLFRSDVSDEQVVQVCRDIMADGFIRATPEGYETVLEADGSNLSMGQRQLIALARALVSGAGVLIFDESTANIDTETERMIQDALAFVMRRHTTILIAHRLSTIRDVDRIMVLQNGQITQSGRHADLVAQDGLYQTMYRLQQE